MKEQLTYQSRSEIKWPQVGKVEVGPSVDFVYIMRKDGDFTMSPIAQRMAGEHCVDEEQTKQVLLEEYDTFFDKLTTVLQWGYSSKGNFELHLYDPNQLDKGVRVKAGDTLIVSLDPLMNQGVLEHKVSRGYYLGGKKDFGQVARPGADPLSQQAQKIASSLSETHASVAEDDIFSGGSVIASLSELISNGVTVRKLIPGIQVGKPGKLLEMGISVDPVVTYETIDGADIFDKVDLGDPRDYLLGASGLVTKLPNSGYGRVPYILPFVSTTARAGIPQEQEKEFAEKVLQASLEFYKNVERSIGKSILLKNMDPNFVVLMNEMFGFDSNVPMEQVVVWAMNNMDGIWEVTQKQGELQEKLASLGLPKNIIFLDVNGTLFSDDSPDGYIPGKSMGAFKKAVFGAKQKGLSVGLCSDSPLPQLKQLAEGLGIEGPIIAENGNMIYHNSQSMVVNGLPDLDSYKQQIASLGADLSIQQTENCVAPEFGGNPVEEGRWSFGANRETSIAVFGPTALIEQLGKSFKGTQGISADYSPEHNFFAIHPGLDYKQNKGKALSLLTHYGHNIVMVGNSMSDWVDPKAGVKCVFVAGSRIAINVTGNAVYVSDNPLIDGVIDILERINTSED